MRGKVAAVTSANCPLSVVRMAESTNQIDSGIESRIGIVFPHVEMHARLTRQCGASTKYASIRWNNSGEQSRPDGLPGALCLRLCQVKFDPFNAINEGFGFRQFQIRE